MIKHPDKRPAGKAQGRHKQMESHPLRTHQHGRRAKVDLELPARRGLKAHGRPRLGGPWLSPWLDRPLDRA
jgi:hypothetical protein